MKSRCLVNLYAGLLSLSLGACFPEDADDPPSWIDYSGASPSFSIGGTVVGTAGVLTLQTSTGTLLNVAANGSFEFETPMVSSALYKVTVAVPPRTQTCTVANGSGTVGSAGITDVIVVCR
jgi:hypothetical protein